jgi:predicted RNA methylase
MRANKTLSTKKIIPLELFFNNIEYNCIINLIKLPYNSDVILFNSIIQMLKNLNEFNNTVIQEILKEINITEVIDLSTIITFKPSLYFISCLYQCLKTEGNKNENGSYYTPKDLVSYTFQQIKFKENSIFLDPCCGTGHYLIEATKYFNINNIYGCDIDFFAVKIAQINLILLTKCKIKPNIICADFLQVPVTKTVDYILTNPPYGDYNKRHNQNINTKEMFSLFIYKSLEIIKEECSFVLPESITNVKSHENIRNHIIKNSCVTLIENIGKKFNSVFTNIVVLNLKKIKNSQQNINIFNINCNSIENKIIDKLYNIDYITLKNNADWALGIVTGNNSKYISTVKHNDLYEPIIKGTDIEEFNIREPKQYIYLDINNLQQVAPISLYRHPNKLVYRFISDKLVFAIDNNGRLTLNSANILIPKILDVETICKYLNSDIFQFIYRKKYNSLKVLRWILEELPFPKINSDINCYNLTESEKELIRGNFKNRN